MNWLQDRFYLNCKIFFLTLPAHQSKTREGYTVDSIYRMKLPSCKLYIWILSSLNCGNLRQAKNRKVKICSAVPTPLFSTLTRLSCFIVSHFSFTQNWAWQTWYLIVFLLDIWTLKNSLALHERSITGNHLRDDSVRNFSLAVLFWRSWFHRRIIH